MKPKNSFSFLLLLLLSFLLFFAQSQTPIKKYRILTYGLPDISRENASNVISQKWGIEYYAVAGCTVSEELVDSVKRENNKANKLIEKKYGKKWQDNFYNEIDTEYAIEMKVDSLVKEQNFIQHADLRHPFPGSFFPMHPINKDGDYIVAISNYNANWEEQKLYSLLVNYKRGSVKILNDFTVSK